MTRFFTLTWTAVWCATLAAADTTERSIILELRGDSVEFFSSLPTSDYMAIAPDALADLTLPNGAINYDGIRDTPADFGQIALDRFGFRIPGYQAEAMSMMVHTRDGAYPYTTVMEAFVAASVCGLPERIEALPPDQTRIYQSAFVDMPNQPTRFDFTAPFAQGPIDFRIFADDGRLLRQSVLTPGETVTVDAVIPPAQAWWHNSKIFWGMAFLLSALGLFAWGVLAPGHRRTPTQA